MGELRKQGQVQETTGQCGVWKEDICKNNTSTTTSVKNKKIIALTFDDGPTLSTTPLILDKLQKYNVKASFFLLGQNITDATKTIIEREMSLGCEINNHSWTHSYMDQLESCQIKDEIQKTNEAIYKMTGIPPAFFRPPYIAINNTMYDAIDLPFINGIGCTDWDPAVSSETRSQTILDKVKDGDILLLHDFDDNAKTVDALDSMIKGLIDKGYSFVTVSELFKIKGIDPNVKYKIWSNVS